MSDSLRCLGNPANAGKNQILAGFTSGL